MPTWLAAPGPLLLRRHVQSSKYDPAVEEVELIHATPNYAIVRLPSGNESTVSLKDIAPVGQADVSSPLPNTQENELPEVQHDGESDVHEEAASEPLANNKNSLPEITTENTESNVELRRSTRVRKPVDRYGAVSY